MSSTSRTTDRVGPPLRPSPADTAVLAGVVREMASRGPLRGLVLGVTPEMARLPWPDGTDLLAVDRSAEMIREVWPGWPAKGQGALQADWLDMELPPRSRDLAVSDGCFGVLRYPDQTHRVLRKVHGVLRPEGRFAFRVFARPAHPEEPADVYKALMSGAIGSFHAFKLRLLMAVQHDSRAGVVVGHVWQSWHRDGPPAADLAALRGWPIEEIETIEAWRGLDSVQTFPALAELREVIAAEGFDEIGCTWQRYELGERCPTLVLARR